MKATTTLASAILACLCAAQQQERERTRGPLFKSEIDGLVRVLRTTAKTLATGAYGDGSARVTAMALTAMGHSHRHYTTEDGPVVRDALLFLFSRRQADGTFADPLEDADGTRTTTGWVIDALTAMDPEAYRQEIVFGHRWLSGRGVQRTPWQGRIAEVLGAAAEGTWPQERGAAIASNVRKVPPEPAAAVRALVELVACQAANLAMDGEEAGAAAAFPATMHKGIAFLLTQQEDGVFMVTTPAGRFPDPGLTAMGLSALQTKPPSQRTGAEQEIVDKGIAWLLAQQNEDGSFGQQTVNYVTCSAVMALAPVAARPEVRLALDRAQRFILTIQNVEQNSYQRSDRDYGSIGYGSDQRGDLSNTQMALEALRRSGLDENNEAFQKALVFLQRTQNLKSSNDYQGYIVDGKGKRIPVVSGDDGGSAYYPGNSPAGYVELPDGSRVPRSYGSMTYALLKSYTMAGIPPTDPRMRAAVDWIRRHWTLDINPGSDPELGEKVRYQGLFYYYMVMAQALASSGIDEVETQEGVKVDWRADLARKLATLQKPTGAWVNDKNDRWYEGFSLVCTSYAMLALDLCQAR